MTYRLHQMPYRPQDGSVPKWEVTVFVDHADPRITHVGGTIEQFDTERDALRYVHRVMQTAPDLDARITVRAVHA